MHVCICLQAHTYVPVHRHELLCRQHVEGLQVEHDAGALYPRQEEHLLWPTFPPTTGPAHMPLLF